MTGKPNANTILEKQKETILDELKRQEQIKQLLQLSKVVEEKQRLAREKERELEGLELEIKEEQFEEEVLSLQDDNVSYLTYNEEKQLPLIQKLIDKELSEPYSIFTYRYFLNGWPKLCWMAMCDGECIGTIICKLEMDRRRKNRGYIAMLAVDTRFRGKGIGSKLVKLVIKAMKEDKCDVVVLETEITNKGALALYEKLDFVREKRLHKYYLNGVDAFRLKLWLSSPVYGQHPES